MLHPGLRWAWERSLEPLIAGAYLHGRPVAVVRSVGRIAGLVLPCADCRGLRQLQSLQARSARPGTTGHHPGHPPACRTRNWTQYRLPGSWPRVGRAGSCAVARKSPGGSSLRGRWARAARLWAAVRLWLKLGRPAGRPGAAPARGSSATRSKWRAWTAGPGALSPPCPQPDSLSGPWPSTPVRRRPGSAAGCLRVKSSRAQPGPQNLSSDESARLGAAL